MTNTAFCGCEHCQHQLCVSRVPIFSDLAPEELSRIADLIVRRKYNKGEIIIMEGSRPESLVIIDRGRVKVFRNTHEGKEQILYIFTQGDFFGEKNLLKNQEATYNAEALEPTDICMIDKKAFQDLLRQYPDIGIKIIDELCGRMEKIESAVQSMGTKSIETRINGLLLDYTERYGQKSARGMLVELPLSREGIANFLGVTRETVSRKLSILQDEGIIESIGNKKILILDADSLKE